MNNHLVLISGKSATGKTASLRNLKDPEKVIYLNAEANKGLPFPAKFKQLTVTDPYQVFEAFDYAEAKDFHTIVIDSLSFLMDMYESIHVIPAADGRKAWGGYAQFFKQLMQEYVAKSTKNIVFLAHTNDVYNEKEFIQETMVKVKGSLMNQGVEAWFSHVISTKKLSLKAVEEVNNPLLTITDDDKIAGVKYCYQTRITKDSVGERMRGPMGLWAANEVYIDNDIQYVIDRLHNYYQ